MSFIITLIMAFTIGFTGSQAQAHADTPSQAPTQAVCEEDMECWDCTTMGNMDCASDAVEADAWTALDSMNLTLPAVPYEMVLTYVNTVQDEPHNLSTGVFTVRSHTSTAWHVFKWDTLHHA